MGFDFKINFPSRNWLHMMQFSFEVEKQQNQHEETKNAIK